MPIPNGGYTFSGQATTYGSNGLYSSQISGTATPTNSFSRGFASGYNMGLAIQAAQERSRWKNAYADCMQKLGWSQAPKGEAAQAQQGGMHYNRNLKTPVGATCNYSGDCEGTSVCQKNVCTPRPD
jgi:hypothetical protein